MTHRAASTNAYEEPAPRIIAAAKRSNTDRVTAARGGFGAVMVWLPYRSPLRIAFVTRTAQPPSTELSECFARYSGGTQQSSCSRNAGSPHRLRDGCALRLLRGLASIRTFGRLHGKAVPGILHGSAGRFPVQVPRSWTLCPVVAQLVLRYVPRFIAHPRT